MAELATIARPYAEALFKASRGDYAAVQSWLGALEAVTDNAQLLQFAADPRASADQVFQLINGVLQTPLPERGANFLRALVDNGRLAALPEIARQFRVLVNGTSGTADVLVQSAFPMGDATLQELVCALEKRFGRKLQATVSVNPDLIGGVRVVVGDEVMDTSVKARLEQMKAALAA